MNKDISSFNQEIFKLAIESSNDLTTITDAIGVAVYVSPQSNAITSYDPDEILGKNLAAFLHPEDAGKGREAMDVFTAGAQLQHFEYRIIDKDGETRWLSQSSNRVVFEENEVVIQNTIRNITQQKQNEQMLVDANASLAMAQEVADIGSWDWNIVEGTLSWSDMAYRQFGLRPGEVVPTYELFESFVHPDDLPVVNGHVQSALDGRDEYLVDARMINPDGRAWVMRAQGRVVRDASGKAIRFVGTQQNIIEQKKLEAQLLQAQKLESLGTLAGGIAHDFNNMLAIIMGNTELLTSTLIKEKSSGLRYLEKIKEAGDRSTDLSKQILTFGRNDGAQLQPLDMRLVVEEALQLLRATIPTNIEIRLDCAENYARVLADKTQIHQIIVNLITNAFHAMEEKGGLLEVVLKELECGTCSLVAPPMKSHEACLQLTVRDTGCGISPAHLERAFDPFFTTKDVGRGTGLGLAVAFSIVQNHGGLIEIDSVVDEGTVVKVCLPVIDENSEANEIQEQPTEAAVREGSGNILLVEDEASLAAVFEEFLKGSGYGGTVCTDGTAAFELFQKEPNRFDLVLTDQAMPNMTGKQLSQKILKIRPELPIVLATGYSGVVSDENADAIGIRKYLVKPVRLNVLRQAIEDCLGSP